MLDNETFHDITIGLAEGHGHIRANKTGDIIIALFACICTRKTEGFRNTMQIGNVNEKRGRKLG